MFTDRPGIFVRLSNLIIFQVLFIFAALILILFFPGQDREHRMRTCSVREHVQQTAQLVSRALEASDRDTDSSAREEEFNSLIGTEPGIDEAAVYLAGEGVGPGLLFYHSNSHGGHGENNSGEALIEYVDTTIIRFMLGRKAGDQIHASPEIPVSVIYTRLEYEHDGQAAVMVASADHGLVMSTRSRLQYALLILFLFAALNSLLTVYLMSKRFRQPLDKLIRGLERTSEGELYYLIEPEGDSEFRRLANAFNTMTRKLWDNQKQLKKYNTKLKKSSLSIIESQLFLATLIDNSPFSIIVVNAAGRILIFNQAASEVFGYSSEETVGQPVDRLFAEPPHRADNRDKDSSGRSDREARCIRKDDESFPAYIVSSPVFSQGDEPAATLYIIRDISESKNFQDMMIRLDRYYTRGEMAGEIAHEINNYLAVLMGNLELLPMLLEKGKTERIDKKLDIMKTTVDQVARFANGLMDRSHGDAKFELTSPNQLVENIIAFIKPQNRFDIVQIFEDLTPEVPVLEVDQGQLQQLLVNLIYNASEVLLEQEGEKRITVATSAVTVHDTEYVQVDVRDNGPGVPADRENRLFEERFTTKKKGHGIGLITCRKIVANHGGTISYRNDNGAVFSIRLPVRRNGVAATTGEIPKPAGTVA